MLFTDLVHLLDPEPHDAPLNMAIDEVILQQAELPTLRIYRWVCPALSFGYFGKIEDVEAMRGRRELVRRWTGGGIVEHGDDLTYTLVVPRSHAFSQRSASESYRLIHEVVAAVLATEGAPAEMAGVSEGVSASGACFVNPVQYDVLAGGRKIAGAAQRRTRWGLLHQGSVQTVVQDAGEKLSGLLAGQVEQRELSPGIVGAAEQLSATKYATGAWLRKF